MAASPFSPGSLTPTGASSPPGTPGASPAPARSGALLSRITTILSASYSDLGIRDALETLDARHVENTPETRRQLRLDVQRDVIQANGDIVHDFGEVAERLKRVGATIDSINKTCADMQTRISAASTETAPLLEETNTLLSQKAQVESKQHLLEAFNSHFLVSDEQAIVLTSSAEPVDDKFFSELTRVKRIHRDSQILLGVSEHQRLGLEVLESSSRQLNGAFQKLYRWIQREFKSTVDLENPQISAAIRRALRVLAERPALFQSCLDFFAEARENILSDVFYAALTASSIPEDKLQLQRIPTKPIEFQAHDPLRYVGDMLAWAHSATVSEREALEVLFVAEGDEIAKGIQAGLDNEPWTRQNDHDAESAVDAPEPFDGRKALGDLVSRNLTGVMRQLRQRTEQVVQSHEDASLAYKIANLLKFYQETFQKLLGSDSSVISTLDSLSATAQRQFRSTTRDNVTQIQADLRAAPDTPPDSAPAPPDFLIEALETLTVLLKSYDTSLPAMATEEDDSSSAGFSAILAEALDPYLDACEELCRRLPGSREANIFGLNCLFAVQGTLSTFPAATATRKDKVAERIRERSASLTNYAHRFLLEQSGLFPLLNALEKAGITTETEEDGESEDSSDNEDSRKEKAKKIRQLAEFRPELLSQTAAKLDSFLPEALMEASGLVRELRNASVGQEVASEAAERFCLDFETLEEWIDTTDELVPNEDGDGLRLKEVFPRTNDEIRVLLS